MLYNWPRALPLYADAERQFRRLKDPRGVLAARLGWLRAEAYEEPSPALTAEVDRDLRNPIIQGAAGLIYHLRHTFATRLSAGGASDHFVTLMLRQEDAQAFKRYRQAKLNMMREALARLDRHANEREESFVTHKPN